MTGSRTSNHSKETRMPATRIIVKNNGSIRVEGDFEIVDETGKSFDLAGRDAIGLCRCG